MLSPFLAGGGAGANRQSGNIVGWWSENGFAAKLKSLIRERWLGVNREQFAHWYGLTRYTS